MKKTNLTSMLGTAIVIGSLTSLNLISNEKISKSKESSTTVFKIKDRTNDESAVSDGSKTEKTAK